MPITKTKVNYHLNLEKELSKLKPNQRTEAKNRIAEYVLTEIENHTHAGVSPVTGGNYKKLSKDYAAKKKKIVGSGKPDLHLTDAMMNSLKTKNLSNGVEFKITDALQKKKMFNHSTVKDSINTSPKRMALPDDGQDRGKEKNFSPAIREGIKSIIKEMYADND